MRTTPFRIMYLWSFLWGFICISTIALAGYAALNKMCYGFSIDPQMNASRLLTYIAITVFILLWLSVRFWVHAFKQKYGCIFLELKASCFAFGLGVGIGTWGTLRFFHAPDVIVGIVLGLIAFALANSRRQTMFNRFV